MHLTPNMYKMTTLKANAKEIVTVKCIWHQICTKSLLWRQMLRKSFLENAFDTKYIQNHHVEPNPKKIVILICIWHHICTKPLLWRQMLRKSSLKNVFDTTYIKKCYFEGKCYENHYLKMHVAPHMCKTCTLKANAQEIITVKCIWHQICTKLLCGTEMLRKSSPENAFDTTYIQNCYFEGKC